MSSDGIFTARIVESLTFSAAYRWIAMSVISRLFSRAFSSASSMTSCSILAASC